MKKSVALLLLLLFIFIYTVKIFHAHTTYENVSQHSATAFIKSVPCSICDFQIAKDGDIATSFIQLQFTVSYLFLFFNYIHSNSFYTPYQIDVRGPPHFA